jgi:hypothetical protein
MFRPDSVDKLFIVNDIKPTLRDKFNLSDIEEISLKLNYELEKFVNLLKKDKVPIEVINKEDIIFHIEKSLKEIRNNKFFKVISLDYSIHGDIKLDLCKSKTFDGIKLISRIGSRPFIDQVTAIKIGFEYYLVDEISFTGETLLMVKSMIENEVGIKINNIAVGIISNGAYENLVNHFNNVYYIQRIDVKHKDSIMCARNIVGLDGKLLENNSFLPFWARTDGIWSLYRSQIKELHKVCNNILDSNGIFINWGETE